MSTPLLLPIYAFRHGQTDWNKEGRIQGHLDVPLNEKGRAEGTHLAHALRRVRVHMILSSDLSRAVDTAKLSLSEAMRKGWHSEVPILTDSRLREVHLGRLQGLTRDEIQERFGATLSQQIGAKLLSDEDLRDLGSEPTEDLLHRLLSSIKEVSQRAELSTPGSALAISTHGGVLRRLLHAAAGIDEIRFSIPNAAFFPFLYDRATKRLHYPDFVPFTAFEEKRRV